MFCPNCGQQVPDDAQFCDNCGTSLVEEGKEASAPTQTAPKQKSETLEHVTKYVKEHKALIGIVAAVLVVAIALTVFFTTRPMKIDLNDYVKITYEGYDTAGTAEFTFDKDAFYDDFAGKLKYQGRHMDEVGDLFDDDSICRMFLSRYVDYDISKDSDLSNGETVQVEWDCDVEAAKRDFGVKLVCKNKDFTVSGLEVAEEIDPFSLIKVTFSGTSPNGRARLEWNSDAAYVYDFDFKLSAKESLKNGDTVTVTVRNAESEKKNHYLLRKYGIIFSKTEQTYTVSGLDTYVTKLSEINDDAWTNMKNQCNDIMKSHVAKNWEKATLKGMEYVGSYFLDSKEQDTYNHNYIYLIFKVTASYQRTDDETKETVDETIDYYFSVRFQNLMLSEDGSVIVDLSRYETPYKSFSKPLGGWASVFFRGYETLEEAYASCVTANADRFNAESNIKAE